MRILLAITVGLLVVLQIRPAVRDKTTRLLDAPAIGGVLAGMALMYATGLLVTA